MFRERKMSLLDELIRFITQGSTQGIPAIAVMAISLVLGLVVGYFVKKLLKLAIIVLIILAVLTYFGFLSLSFGSITELIATYGPAVAQYAMLILGILPLSIGFIIGLIIGFIFA